MSKKINVLIVEDEILIAVMLKDDLELNGFNISGVLTSGEEAEEKAVNENIDIILMDIRLSGEIDGIEAAEQILKVRQIPIIFLTGYSIEEYRKRIEKMKYAAFINKPVDIRKLVDIIKSVF